MSSPDETGRGVKRAWVQTLADPGLGNSSYLVDLGRGLAAAVDPPRDIEGHHEAAERAGVRIVASLETHLHADFVSGSRELADHLGAETYAARDGHLCFAHHGVAEGEVIRLGETELSVLHTPGHTPEHVAYVVGRPGHPDVIFTGGSLIGGGAARTDLISSDRTEELARAQFRSFRRLATLPDDVVIHPTHGAGSFCSAGPASKKAGTIGDQRRSNPLFAIDDEQRFVRELLSGYGSFPPYFLRLREVNRAGPPLSRTIKWARPLAPAEAAEQMDHGAWLVDARSIHDWARAHPVGAVSIELRPAFASWLGWVVPFGEPVLLLIDPDDVPEALRQARRIGYDRIVGWIDGGIDAWRAAGLPVASTDEVDARQAAERAESGAKLLDVRQDSEYAIARIPDAVHVELGSIIAGQELASADAVAFCGHGERSATAASLLERRGARVANLVGGLAAWEKAGLRVER